MLNNNTHYRNRQNKQPVYTSDKRAKFTQRENKKWIRLATVFGYIVSVSMPAVVLSIYYICIWNPGGETRFPANATPTPSIEHLVPSTTEARPLRGIKVTISDGRRKPSAPPFLEAMQADSASLRSSQCVCDCDHKTPTNPRSAANLAALLENNYKASAKKGNIQAIKRKPTTAENELRPNN